MTGPEATTTDGLASRVQSASVLLMTGRVEEGCALLEAVTVPIRNLGEPVLRADALLARGPVDVGSGDARGLLEESRRSCGFCRRQQCPSVCSCAAGSHTTS
ncbi:MAG: hypothetical protein R2716_02110 [Microthrixaceae bacterium]